MTDFERDAAPGENRFHVLLCRGGSDDDFVELVAENGITQSAGDWRVTAELPMAVSSVEADARLARWSKHTGGLAIRITRTDDIRWWLAVHHAGRRLVVLVYSRPPEPGNIDQVALSLPQLGRDPLLELLAEKGASPFEVQAEVAHTRAGQLAAALAQGDVMVPVEELERVLGAPGAASAGNVSVLLDRLGAPRALDVLQSLSRRARPSRVGPVSVQGVLGRALLTGCVLPIVAAATLFVLSSRLLARAGLGPFLAMTGGILAGWLGLAAARRLVRRIAGSDRWRARLALSWAAASPAAVLQAVRPSAAALHTWGGLFYLLRDIAFFGGIDRPGGPSSLYLEAWAFGPPELVEAINRAASREAVPEPLLDLAAQLVELRAVLIDRHLAGERIAPDQVQARVRALLRPVVTP